MIIINIGILLKKRMEKLNVSVEELSERSLVEEDIIRKVLDSDKNDNKILSFIDLEFILEALYLPKDCLENLKDADMYTNNSLIKSKIDLIMEDFDFVMRIYNKETI